MSVLAIFCGGIAEFLNLHIRVDYNLQKINGYITYHVMRPVFDVALAQSSMLSCVQRQAQLRPAALIRKAKQYISPLG